jgi:hypothetical protein
MGSLFSSYRIWVYSGSEYFFASSGDDISDYSGHNYRCIESLCMS